MKVAVVGAGTMGALHAQLLAETEDVETVLVVDVDQGRASDEAARIGGRAASFEEALTEADAVVISTPPQFHEQQVTAAIEAGLHVMCEKPLTDRLDSTLALAERIESEGAHVEVGFQRRHDAGFRRAREGISGRIHVVRLTAHDPIGSPQPPPSGDPPETAPIFRDSSIHDFDVVRWLTGQEVTEVAVEAGRRDGRRPTDPREIESAGVTMRLSGGGIAILEASWLHPAGYDVRLEVISEGSAVSGGLSARTPTRHADWDEPNAGWAGYLERFEAAYRAELVDFLACCRGVRPAFSTARDGVEAMRIAVAATRAFSERRLVRLDEIPGLPRREVA